MVSFIYMKSFDNTSFHTAIIGAGAAGLFCAGSFNAPKIILEANELPGRKVRVSGGGKCNFTNRFVSATDYQSQNLHFCKSALAAFNNEDFINLLNQADIPFEERPDGRLFAQSANDIVSFLVHRAKRANSQLACGVRVLEIHLQKGIFVLHTSAGTVYAQHVVVATGGLSYPALGANPFGWQLARKLGLNVIDPAPALCGLTLPKEKRIIFSALAGNSIPARVRYGKHHFEDQVLFTHDGLSGPAILQISLFWKPGEEVEIDFLPNLQVASIFREHKTKNQLFSTVVGPLFPGKIAKVLLKGLDVPLANASRAQLDAAINALHHFRFVPSGTAGYTKAEVTSGGVDTRELNPSTLQTRKIPGLYFIGELIDVTGRLGGFNLQWAWSSAFAAAQDLAQKF